MVKIPQLTRLRSLAALNKRVEQLENEVQECRHLNLRLASITDLVNELLLELADNEDPGTAEAIQRYRDSVGEVSGRR